MLRLLTQIFSVIQDVLIVTLLIPGLAGRKRVKEKRTLSLPPIIFWVGFIDAVVFSIPVTLGLRVMPFGTWLVFEGFTLLGVYMILAYCNEVIRYDESGFEEVTFFGKSRRYKYKDISGMFFSGGDSLLVLGKRKIRVSTMAYGSKEFMTFAGQRYFSIYKKSIPKIENNNDPMKGNLDTPWLYLFFSVLMFFGSIFIIGTIIKFVVLSTDMAYKNEQTPAAVGVFIFCMVAMVSSVLMVIVGRHPERFSPKFRRLFYQDGAWMKTVDEKNVKHSKNRKVKK